MRPIAKGPIALAASVGGIVIATLLFLRSFSLPWQGFDVQSTNAESAGLAAPPVVPNAAAPAPAPASATPDLSGGAGRFTVAVAPLTVLTDDPVTRPTLESMYPALIAELRLIPNINIIELEAKIENLDELRPRGPADSATDLTEVLGVEADIYFEPMGQYGGQQPWSFSIRFVYTRDNGGGVLGRPAPTTSTPDVQQMVRETLAIIQRMIFPPDPSVLADLRSRVLDPNVTDAERLDALNSIMRWAGSRGTMGGGRPTEQAQEVTAITAEILTQASDPEVRYRALTLMVNADTPELIPTVAETLRNDSVDYVRLAAAQVLARQFSDDPTAQAALAAAAEVDSAANIRLHAQWAVLDDAGRRAEVIATLANPELSDRERISLITEDVSDLSDYLDAEAIGALIEIASRSNDSTTTPELVYALGQVDEALVVPVLLDRLATDSDAAVRAAAASVLIGHVGMPGVRDALDLARASDPSEDVRAAANIAR